MKNEVERRKQVTNLADYRKKRQQQAKNKPRDAAKILDEVSHYLLLAAKAMASRSPH